MDQLAIREKVGVNYMLYECSGSINAYTLNELQEKISACIIDSNVVLDLEQITSMDSSGVGLVLATHNDGEENGTRLFLMNLSETAKHSLERTGFMDTFNLIHSVTEVSDVH